MKELQDRINRLRITNSEPVSLLGYSSPVSFSFHCEIGEILRNDSEDLTEMDQHDKMLPDSTEILFIP